MHAYIHTIVHTHIDTRSWSNFANKAASKMEASGEVYKANKEHFVLVHGAGHGAWCWFKLACLLRGSGHRVSCIDLAGAAGSLVDPDDVRSFDEYDAPLMDFMAALPDGHKVSDAPSLVSCVCRF